MLKHSYVYDHYYKYDEITDIVKGYAEKHPGFVDLSYLAVTPEGRNIWLLSITDKSTGSCETKPALYVEGNIHAGEVTGCMTVMYLLDSIFSNLDDESVKGLLKTYAIYAVPRLSPDGSEYYLTTPHSVRSAPRFYPFDAPQPGLPSRDMDGDGSIRMMRVKTPYGAWKVSKKDPRVMVRRQPDDVEGDFYNIYDEGYIEGEYDGVEIKPAPAPYGNDFNRNYPIGWQSEDVQRGSGDYPLSNLETRANADFLLAHPNVCAVVDMHTSGGQILYTPGYMSGSKANPADIAVYKAMGKLAQQENGFPILNLYDQYMPASHPQTCGGFDDFCHFVLGIPAMTIECWDPIGRSGLKAVYPPREDFSDEENEDNLIAMIKWVDETMGKDVYKPWTKLQHPQLGEVEIGGVDPKFVTQNPPPKYLEEEISKHTAFLLRLPKMLPRLSIDSVEVKELGAGLYSVEAICGNRGFMSTYVFKEGLKSKRLKGVSLELKGLTVAEGPAKHELGHLEGNSGYMAMGMRLTQTTAQTGPMRKKVSWVVKGNKGDSFEIVCASGKAGEITFKATL